jgi:hypothetical protein
MAQINVDLRHPVTDEPVTAIVDYIMVNGEQLYAVEDGVEKFRAVMIPEVKWVEYFDQNGNKLDISLKMASSWDEIIVDQLMELI